MPTLPFKTISVNGQKYEVSKAVVTFANLTFVSQSAGVLKFTSDLDFDQALIDFKAGKSLMVHTDYLTMFGDVQITESLDGTKLQGVGNLAGQLVGYTFYPYFDEQTQDYDYSIWMCSRNYYNNTSATVGSVTVTPVISTGTKIATVDVDGVETDLYAPAGGGGGSVKVLEAYCSSWNSGNDPGARDLVSTDYSSWAGLIAGIKAGDTAYLKVLDFDSHQEQAYIRLDNIVTSWGTSKIYFTAYSGNGSMTYVYYLEEDHGSSWVRLAKA